MEKNTQETNQHSSDQSNLPEQVNQTNNSPQFISRQVQIHEGPLPTPQDFAAYESILPGSANRIIQMAERQQKAEISLRKRDWLLQLISMLLGKLFLYVLVGIAFFLLLVNKPIEALFVGLSPIISVIYSTFFGSKREERDE